MINKEKLEEIKKELEKEKAELLKQVAGHSKPVDFGDDIEGASEEEADEAEEFGNQLSIAQSFRERLEEVENAINKINGDQYGLCENCSREIEDKDLLKNPTQPFCSDCRDK